MDKGNIPVAAKPQVREVLRAVKVVLLNGSERVDGEVQPVDAGDVEQAAGAQQRYVAWRGAGPNAQGVEGCQPLCAAAIDASEPIQTPKAVGVNLQFIVRTAQVQRLQVRQRKGVGRQSGAGDGERVQAAAGRGGEGVGVVGPGAGI